MPDAIEVASPETSAPRSMADSTPAPTSTPTPEPSAAPAAPSSSVPDSGGEAYNPAQDNEAGFAAFRAAKQAASDAPATKAEVVAAAVADATGAPAPSAAPTEAAPTKTDEPSADDAKLNRIFNRIAALEKERDEARGSLSRLEQRAARADELEQKLAKLKSSPTELMNELGWNQDTLAEYILKGNEATSPKLTAVEQEQKALKDELEALKRERAEGERARKINEFKSSIPSQLKDAKTELKHLGTYFDSDAEMADAVWNVMASAYQTQKTELTVVEAARAVENVLAEQAKRFSRASSQSPTSSNTAPATKPAPTPTLTNKSPTTTPAKTAESDDVSPNYAAAAELLRSFRKQ